MEYVEGGELFSYIHEQGGLIEIHVVHIFRQIIAALIYCHRISIHHRDLKPENILLDRETMTVKLVDFGMAALQPSGKKLTTPCGSPHYAAPEVIKTTAYDGGKADVWSCGVILYVLLTGTPPFNYSGEDRDLKYLFKAIEKGDYVMPDTLSREAADLIRRILIPAPKQSPAHVRSALTGLALVPVHDQWPLERVPIRLQSPERICLILCSLDNPADSARPAQIVQNVLQLVSSGRFLGYIKLEFSTLGLVVRIVGAGLIFGGSRDGVRVSLLKDGVRTYGGLAGGLVEEGHNILHAVL